MKPSNGELFEGLDVTGKLAGQKKLVYTRFLVPMILIVEVEDAYG
jgi:hypothetical protein